MDSVVDVRDVGTMAILSPVTGARMVNSDVQCSPRQPVMVQRAVQVAPVHAVTRNVWVVYMGCCALKWT